MVESSVLQAAATQIRSDILTMAHRAGTAGAHLGGSLSLVEIMTVLYLDTMRYRIDEPDWPDRDRLILSKGHGAMAMYAAMKQAGILTNDHLKHYKQKNSPLTAHPSINLEIGVEVATGSLGQGLSYAAGACLALKKKGNLQSRYFVVLGDGECNEGQIWEAAASASHYALDNLIAVVDKNQLQYDGKTDEVLSMGDLAKKWLSFGWETRTVDGHNVEALAHALNSSNKRPLVVIAETVKGKGVSFMENKPKWHNAVLSDELYAQAQKEQVSRYATI